MCPSLEPLMASPSASVSSVGASVAVTCASNVISYVLVFVKAAKPFAGCVRISSRKLGTLPPTSVPP